MPVEASQLGPVPFGEQACQSHIRCFAQSNPPSKLYTETFCLLKMVCIAALLKNGIVYILNPLPRVEQ
jgi:hypothetical protein